MILEVDEEKRRISLGVKQLTENPWQVFSHKHQEGDKISGKIKSITDFGTLQSAGCSIKCTKVTNFKNIQLSRKYIDSD